MAEPKALRHLGPFELFASSRHHLGIYRCVVVSARYQTPRNATSSQQEASLASAIASIVRDQPLLRVGILSEDEPKKTVFSHIASIDLRNHVEWHSIESQAKDDYETRVSEMQGWLHDQRFPEVGTRPPWKVLILRPADGVFSEPHVDVLFSFHHALSDGTGGKEFHEHLISALRDQDSIPDNGLMALSFPEAPELPEPEEEVIEFRNTYSFLAWNIWDMLAPSFLKPHKVMPWTAKLVNLSNPYKTRVRRIDLDAKILNSLLVACREHSTTLTCTLHALVLTSLARRLPASEASSFTSSTPISLRPWISSKANPVLKTKLRVLVTSHMTFHLPSIVEPLRDSTVTDELIWESSQRIKQDLTNHTSQIPVNDVIGLIPLISDLFSYWHNKDGQPRKTTWEVSNVGVLWQLPKDSSSESSGWKITKAMFTNGAMIVGASIGINVVSVEGGGLTVAVTWQEGDIEEQLVQGVSEDMMGFATQWYATGKFLG